ncbi:MAG: flagellar biosynthetic protein FliR [Nitrospiraceae bacterium]
MNAGHTLQLALPHFQIYTVLLVRIAGIISAFPILNSRSIPLSVKTGLVTMLGLVLAPVVSFPKLPDNPEQVVAGIASEFLIGLVIGLAVRLLFAAFEVAGELVGSQMGFSVVQLLDPSTRHQTPLIGQFHIIIASLVFLALNAHLFVVRAIGMSYELVPPFGASLSDDLALDVVRLSQDMLVVALKLAAPVFCTILIVNVSMAMLGRAVAQMNVFVLSFPITIGAGLFVMGLALPYSLHLFEGEFAKLTDSILGLLHRLGHV